jgi:hypothetical protein
MTSVASRLAELSSSERAAIALRIEQIRNRGGYAVPRREGANDAAAASFAQERLWFVDALDPGNGVYNITVSLPFDGPLNVRALASGLEFVVERHETLRTCFSFDGDGLLQIVRPPAAVAVPLIDLSHLAAADRDEQVEHVMSRELDEGFDLARGPMLRAVLLRLTGQSHILLITTHHISSDGWSTGILQREIMAAYAAYSRGAVPSLPALVVQYSDYAEWQRARHERGEWQPLIDFWKNELQDAPESLDLPTCRARPLHRNMDGQWVGIDLPAELVTAVEEFARKERCTVFMILLAAFAVLLHRFSGQDDVVIGVPVANRGGVELEPLIGFFVNAVPMRIRATKSDRFVDLAQRARNVALRAFQHQELPFEKLVEEIEPERALLRNPVFQATFSLQNLPLQEAMEAADPNFRADHIRGSIKFDLSLHLRHAGRSIVGSLGYATDVLDECTGDILARNLIQILAMGVRMPDARMDELVLGEDAYPDALPAASAGGGPHRQPKLALPDAGIAAIEQDRTTTWAEIADTAGLLERELAARGLGSGGVDLTATHWTGWLTGATAAARAGITFRPVALEAAGRAAGTATLIDGAVRPGSGQAPTAPEGSAHSYADLQPLLDGLAARMELPRGILAAAGRLRPADSALVALFAAAGSLTLTTPAQAGDAVALLDHATWEGASALIVGAEQARAIAESTHVPLDAFFLWVVEGPLSPRAARLLVERGARGMVLTDGAPVSPWLFGTELAAAAEGVTLGHVLLDVAPEVRDAEGRAVPVGALGTIWARSRFTHEPVTVLRSPVRRRPDGRLEAKVEETEAPARSGETAGETSGPISQSLLGIWEDVLGHPVGLDEDFFAAGGHSLRAAQVVARVKELLRAPITIHMLFEQRTVRRLAADLAARDDSARIEHAARLLLEVSVLSGAEAEARLSLMTGAA